MSVTEISKVRVGGINCGYYKRYKHMSTSTKCEMIFGLYEPMSKTTTGTNTPVLFYLSGLTCDDTNVAIKAGSKLFNSCEEHGIACLMPDTSPRGKSNPDGMDIPDMKDEWDIGIGAGFYVDATKEPYSKNYQMYTYITKELPQLLQDEFSLGPKRSITGHSMGGHGALTITLKDPDNWTSVSAFAPICNPINVPWGQKAFTTYFGGVDNGGKDHDATELLLKSGKSLFDDILIDQGTADTFLETQLKPNKLVEAGNKVGQKITLNNREGFDHSYHFIAAFIDDHVAFHGTRLNK